MPEVPSNMQEGIAHLELEAREVQHEPSSSVSSMSSTAQNHYRDQPQAGQRTSQTPAQYPNPPPLPPLPAAQQPTTTTAYDHTNAVLYQDITGYDGAGSDSTGRGVLPRPSPFPRPHLLPGQRVPPSDNEKEAILINKREHVLNSSDPEMQLAWAQDALLWIDIELQHRARLAEVEVVPPGSPREDVLRKDAVDIVNFLADQRHPKALFIRATWLEFGKFGHEANREEAVRCYRIASERGYARAEYRVGTIYEAMQDMGRAIKHYKAGVALGDAASNYRLGMMSLLGQHGQMQDQQLGIQRIRYAAEMADENSPQGAYVYGMLLARELPNINLSEAILPIDVDQARSYIEKAAFLGFAKAQLKMGSAYELCQLGCDFTPALSLHYNALAAHQGEADADMSISKWFLCGYEDVFEKNEELALRYARRAAQAGLPTAEFAMGYFYEIGMYVPSDLVLARTWYEQAAEHGNKDAVGRLEGISQQKALTKDHEKEAIKRIRSQYGSQRGKRPDRFKEKPVPMTPTVEEPPTEEIRRPALTEPAAPALPSKPATPMLRAEVSDPETNRRSVSSPAFMISPAESRPPQGYPGYRSASTAPYPEGDLRAPPLRPTSTAPYPEDDRRMPQRPLSTAPYPETDLPPVRPVSVAPYPEDDPRPARYSQGQPSQKNPQLRVSSGPIADRPVSAFGIRPDHMQSSGQLHNGYRGAGPSAGPSIRPASSMSNIQSAAAVMDGRGSNPARRHQVMSAGYEPQPAVNYRQTPYQTTLSPLSPELLQPNSAPPVNPNVGRNRLQKAAPMTSKPQPSMPLPPMGQDLANPITPVAPLNYKKLPPSNAPVQADQRPPRDARASLPSNQAQRPARLDSMPPNMANPVHRPTMPQSSASAPINPQHRKSSAPASNSSQHPPRTSSAAPTASSVHPPAFRVPAASSGQLPSKPASAQPPTRVSAQSTEGPLKTGPQTFEEMGIPAHKKEDDCVSVLQYYYA
jgi:TPR repeat protein